MALFLSSLFYPIDLSVSFIIGTRLFRLLWLCSEVWNQTEKAMATHSSTLSWQISWMEEPGRLQSMGSLSRTWLSNFTFHFSLSCTGEGNGNPLQCSCLETPRDGGAWWAAIYGVAQSRTRLTWLSSMKSGCTMLLVLFLLKIALTTHGLCGSHKF